MRPWILAALLSSPFACGRAASDPPVQRVEAPSTVEAQPAARPPADASDKTGEAAPPSSTGEPAPTPAPTKVEASLGAAAAVVRGATQVEIARLRVIGARQAEEQRLTNDTSIAGYPIDGELRRLDRPTQDAIVRVLFDDTSYQWDIARRCANDYLVGLRFTAADARVEFGLGMPCEQGFWVLRAEDAITSTGAILEEAAAKRIVDAAPPPAKKR